jgi:uncharacterized protein YndB with AHSA1/START domain
MSVRSFRNRAVACFPTTVALAATDQLRMKEPPEMDVTRDIVLPVDREDAWEVVSDPAAWLVDEADLELVPGAEGTLDERRAIVEDVAPGERLIFWWGEDGALFTRVELTLDDVRGGTRVTVVESGPATGPVARALGGVGAASRALALA